MNRTNRGYEFPNLDGPVAKIDAPIDATIPNAGEAEAQSAQTLHEISQIAMRRAESEAQRKGRLDGLNDAQSGILKPVDVTTISGEAYAKASTEALGATAEVQIRQRLNQASVEAPDLETYQKETAKIKSEIFGPIEKVMGQDANNPYWKNLSSDLVNIASRIEGDEINRRKEIDIANNLKSQAAVVAQKIKMREDDTIRFARDAVIKGDKTSIDALASSKQDFLKSVIEQGPKTAFVLNGVEYPADNNRSGRLNSADIEKQINDNNLKIFETSQLSAQEKIGKSRDQWKFAEDFAKRWRERPDDLKWLSDEDAQNIEADLFKAANISQNKEEQAIAPYKKDLDSLLDVVRFHGVLSRDQRKKGDDLVKLIGDDGLNAAWHEAKIESAMGYKIVTPRQRYSVSSGSINSIDLGGDWAAPRKHKGRHNGFHVSMPLPIGVDPAKFDAMKKGAMSNPILFAARQKMNVPTLDVRGFYSKDPNQIKASLNALQQRIVFGQNLAQEMGVPVRVFTNQEAEFLRASVKQSPAMQVELARRLAPLGDMGRFALNELKLDGPASQAAYMVTSRTDAKYAMGAILGANNTKVTLSKADNAALKNAEKNWLPMLNAYPQARERWPSIMQSVKNSMLYNLSQGLPAGDPNAHIQSHFGSAAYNGKRFGGAVNINGALVPIPEWLSADGGRQIMSRYGSAIAQHVMDANGRGLSTAQVSRLSLYYLGDGLYAVTAGRNSQGQQQFLRSREGGGIYQLNINRLKPVIRKERPDWVINR